MKFTLNLLIFLLIFTVNIVSAQDAEVKMQFGVLTENGSFFEGLKSSDIRLRQGKKELPTISLEAKTEKPLEVYIMIDTSISQERMLPSEIKAAAFFIDNVLKNGRDKVAIVSFSGELVSEQDLTGDLAKAKEQLGKIEIVLPPGYVGGGVIASSTRPPKNSPAARAGSTSIWDSIKQISETSAKTGRNDARRAIILISDGMNTFGEAKLKEAINASIKNQIPIYAVGIGDEFYGGVDKSTLKKLTGQSNGVLIVPKKDLENLPQQIKKMENGLRSMYEITFAADDNAPKDSLREVEIEIINPELRKQKLQIVQPQGFFASN